MKSNNNIAIDRTLDNVKQAYHDDLNAQLGSRNKEIKTHVTLDCMGLMNTKNDVIESIDSI